MTRKILFVGMVNSPHAARWIDLVADQGWELHFFPVYAAQPHHLMRNITIHIPWYKVRPRFLLKQFLKNPRSMFEHSLEPLPTRVIYPIPVIRPFDRILGRMKTRRLGESAVRAPLFFGPRALARVIRKVKPDLIHSMEFQHAGYNVLEAQKIIGKKNFPKWLATNWGSDIYYYQRFEDHRAQITRLLQNVDYYSCECKRDVVLARELGLVGTAMPVLPNTGGFNTDTLSPLRSAVATSQRRMIMVKGYQHFAGRALTALDALLKCRDVLQGYRIVIFAASHEVIERAEELHLFHGLDVTVLRYLTHTQMLNYFAHARIYLGVSISDAISTSMLEAMAMGAFPIQTNTSCCDEWIEDGKSGFVIPPDDLDAIAAKIRTAITDDALVDRASELNWQTVRTRLDQQTLSVEEVKFYDQIFEDTATKGAMHL